MELTTPVALIIFNRPTTTRRVFEQISKVKPKRLFIIADGPRKNRIEDDRLCKEARELVSKIDWPCEVQTNFSEENMGCKVRFSTGLTWLFNQVEEAIILEDDTLPDSSFFPFCEELLTRYRNDERIMHITGNNFQDPEKQSQFSYYFSRYPHCWGWASWRRAWEKYDSEMVNWPFMRDENRLEEYLQDKNATRYWKKILKMTYNNKIDSWAYRWVLSCWSTGGLTITPDRNLVSHIGAGVDAAHIKIRDKISEALPSIKMKFPLAHPLQIERNREADLYVDWNFFRIRGIIGRTLMKFGQILSK